MFVHIEKDCIYLLVAEKAQLLQVSSGGAVEVNGVSSYLLEVCLHLLPVRLAILRKLGKDIVNDTLQRHLLRAADARPKHEQEAYSAGSVSHNISRRARRGRHGG